MQVTSWGGMSRQAASLAQPAFSSEMRGRLLRAGREDGSKCLIIGNLRSYGDEVLCPDGNYLQTTRCDRVLGIDAQRQTVTAECGVRMNVLQQRLSPLGFMIPVTPGTAHLTLGGAIANDVHGKNHHVRGTFGRFVREFELVRTSGEVLRCSNSENLELFAGTIGGMGLTGAITSATIELARVASPLLRVTVRRFQNLAEFFDIDAQAKDQHEYSVAWIDCLAGGRSLGRGIYSVADHLVDAAPAAAVAAPRGTSRPRVGMPFALPLSPVNRASLSVMNFLYFHWHRPAVRQIDCADWLFPLDAVNHWNHLYGRRGFYQFQCVVPIPNARAAVADMLQLIALRGQGSFLAVLKNFGELPSPGLMSFPMPGTTLALDFPNRGKRTQELLLELYQISAAAGGRLYPAKDGCSPADSLESGYPNFHRFKRLIDPGIASELGRRLGLSS